MSKTNGRHCTTGKRMQHCTALYDCMNESTIRNTCSYIPMYLISGFAHLSSLIRNTIGSENYSEEENIQGMIIIIKVHIL